MHRSLRSIMYMKINTLGLESVGTPTVINSVLRGRGRANNFKIILLLTNHAGKNEIIAPKELIIAQAAKPRGQ